MEWGIVGDLSIVVGGGAVLASAIIGSVTLLYLAYRKRRDDKIQRVKARADAHRQLWHVLGQIAADEEREREEQFMFPDSHIIDKIIDDEWLRDYFRDHAALLDDELHKIYRGALSEHPVRRKEWREHMKLEKDPDIRHMRDLAKRKTEEYEHRCMEIDGRNPLKW